MMYDKDLEILPNFDKIEKSIIQVIIHAHGNISRQELRKEIGGSNTTFIKKISILKDKGMIEEYKGTEGRTKTWYRFTQHAKHLFNISDILKTKKWFSANQKIELFPEFENIAKVLLGKGIDVYNMLGITPQHMILETSLASTENSSLDQEKMRDVLSLCNAIFQKIITERIHPNNNEDVEGYVIFHYRMEKSHEEIQNELPKLLSKYVIAKNNLEQYEAITKLGELSIKYKDLIPILTAAAMNIVNQMNLKKDRKELEKNYKEFKEIKKPDHSIRIQMIVICLKIFKKLHKSKK